MRKFNGIVTYTALAVCAHMPLTAGLIENSPFMPAAHEQENTPEEAPLIDFESSNKYTLKGIMQLAGQYHFSILNQETHKSRWLSLDQSFEDLSLLSYDEASKQLLVNYQNNAIRLPLSLESNIAVAVISGNLAATPRQKAAAISRRPRAFTAQNFNNSITKASDDTVRTALTSRREATNLGSSRSNQPGNNPSADTKTKPSSKILSDHTGNAPKTTAGFSHRFGIDQSRTTYVAPPPEEDDED